MSIAANGSLSPRLRMLLRTAGLCAGLALLVLIAYWGVWYCEFVYFDDPDYVQHNLLVQQGLTWKNVEWAFTTGLQSNWHPLTWLSHMLDAQIFGVPNPPVDPTKQAGPVFNGHHLTNLAFHIANAILLFLLFLRMTGATWRSAFAAALFAVHPAHVESVAWVAERKDLLSTLLALCTLLAYLRYARQPGALRYMAVFGLFALGLMAKPMLVTLPFVLLLLDYWPLGRFPRFGAAGETIVLAELAQGGKHPATSPPPAPVSPWHRRLMLVLEKVPLLALSVVSSVVTYQVQAAGGSVVSEDMLPLAVRLGSVPISYVRYLGMLFWPFRLAIYYPRTMTMQPGPSQGAHLEVAAFLVAVPLLLALTALALLAAWRQRRYVLMGWLWFLGILVPVIGVIQVGEQLMADRYTYLSYTGIFVILAWGAFDLLGRFTWGRIALATVAAASLAACVYLTHRQVGYWRSTETLLVHTLDEYPDTPHMHNNLGVLHWEQGEELRREGQLLLRQGKRAEALEKLNETTAKFNDAIKHWQEAVRLRPGFSGAHSNLGYAYMDRGKVDEAIACFRTAIQYNPTHHEAFNNLGLAIWAKDLRNPQNIRQAIACFRQALVFRPDYLDPYLNLVRAHSELKEWDDVESTLKQLLLLAPSRTTAIASLGRLLWQRGKVDQSIEVLEDGLRRMPEDVTMLDQLAWILATCPDARYRNGPEAVRLAETANRLSSAQSPAILDTLAAAYAEANRFTDALATDATAQRMAAQQGNAALAQRLAARADLYRSAKPFRDAPSGPTEVLKP